MPSASSALPSVLHCCGASVRGRAHTRAGVPNQDAWSAWRTRGEVGIAVADGVGSRPHAEVGARAAAPAVREALRTWSRAAGAPTEALARLVHLFWGLRVFPHAAAECATTCLFAATKPGDRILVGGIGDGLVLVSSPEGQVSAIGLEERDFTNETQALGISRSVLDWRFQEAEFPVGSIALVATDGVSDDLRRDRSADFARELVARCAPLRPQARAAALRRILQAWPTPAHTDDLTLALVWRVEATNEQ